MAKTKWKKIIVAGPLVIETVYPAVPSCGTPKARAEKKKLSSAAQQRMNKMYSYQKLELLLAANFRKGDLVCTLTYDDAHLPKSRKAAEGKLKYFREKLARVRRRCGQKLVMAWNIEGKHGEGRYHHHVVINATGKDYAQLLGLWGQGEIDIKPLQIDKDRNYGTLAAYMCKEQPEKPGQRTWSYTRNCAKPEIETFRVESDTQIQAPKGALVMGDVSEKNAYGAYRWIKYIYLQKRRRCKRKK